jgi:hypothetical protein
VLKEAPPHEADRLVEAVTRLHRIDPSALLAEPTTTAEAAAPALVPVAAEGGKRGT